jgi:transcriptional regulator with XRE-family HTH domain
MRLAKRIRTLRYARGMGLIELATRAKISKTAMYQIEQGIISMPRARTLLKISQALDVPLEVLLDVKPITPSDGDDASIGVVTPIPAMNSPAASTRRSSGGDRVGVLMEKLRVLLASPLAEGVARIVDESYRLLPIIPPPGGGIGSAYAPDDEIEPIPASASDLGRVGVQPHSACTT